MPRAIGGRQDGGDGARPMVGPVIGGVEGEMKRAVCAVLPVALDQDLPGGDDLALWVRKLVGPDHRGKLEFDRQAGTACGQRRAELEKEKRRREEFVQWLNWMAGIEVRGSMSRNSFPTKSEMLARLVSCREFRLSRSCPSNGGANGENQLNQLKP